LLKLRLLGPTPRGSDLTCPGWDPRICFPIKLSNNVEAPGPPPLGLNIAENIRQSKTKPILRCHKHEKGKMKWKEKQKDEMPLKPDEGSFKKKG
jgi:hypothetical protein